MPTEELENALRSALARAAADIPDPEQARQRLLARDYRPGRGPRKLGAGITAATAAGAVVLGLGLSGVVSPAQARGTATIRTTAFTLVKHADGTVTVASNLNVFAEPGILQRALRRDGIPALVTTGSFCSSDPSPAGINQVMAGPKHSDSVTINPAAMPPGTELSFGYFRVANGGETAMALIDTNSYTCTSAVPAPGAPPRGSNAVFERLNPGAKGLALPFPFPGLGRARSCDAGDGRVAEPHCWLRPPGLAVSPARSAAR
jgi:hypothetical protein